MGASISPGSYEEFLALRSEERTRSSRYFHHDERAAEAVEALDLAGQYVSARFDGDVDDNPLVSHVYTLLIAAFMLWGPGGRR